MAVISALRDTIGFFGEKIVANPGAAGGATAMAVAMTFFTANAVYFQERQHPAALFATRPEQVQTAAPQVAPQRQPEREIARAPTPVPPPEDNRFAIQDALATPAPVVIPDNPPIPIRRPNVSAATPGVDFASGQGEAAVEADPRVAGIQELLQKLGYYSGDIDGMRGPMTMAAMETYKQKVGLRGIELSETDLMTSLRNNLGVTAAIPERRPVERAAPAVQDVVSNLISGVADGDGTLPAHIPSAEVVKVQAALRAFGNTDIVVDGVNGGRTETAIREFQALFHLPVTGEIDGTLLDKMRAVGLIH